MGADKLKIFISYSRADMATADALVCELGTSDFTVYIDRRDLPYGEKWQQSLYEFIRDSDTVLFLLSPHSISSHWVSWELQKVTELKKRLVPIVLSPCETQDLPPAIAAIELLPKQGTFAIDSHFSDLVRTLMTNRAWVMEATKLHIRAVDWISAGEKAARLLRGAELHAAEQWRSAKPEKEVISGEVLDYLLSSRQGANRGQRNWIVGSMAVAAGMAVLAFFAYTNSVRAIKEGAEAKRQSNAAIAQSAALTSLASGNDPVRSLLLAHEAMNRSEGKPSLTIVAALRNAVVRFGPAPLFEAARLGLSLYEATDLNTAYPNVKMQSLFVTPDGRWVIATVEDRSIHELWRLDLEARNPETTLRVLDTGIVENGSVRVLAVSGSGRRIAAAQESYGPGVYLFDIKDDGAYRVRIAKWSIDDARDIQCLFSEDDHYLVCGNHLWRLDDGVAEIDPVILPSSGEDFPLFTQDSARVGLATKDGDRFRVTTWTLPEQKNPQRQFFPSKWAAAAAFPRLAVPDIPNLYQEERHSADRRWDIAWGTGNDQHSWPVVKEYDSSGKVRHTWSVPPAPPSGQEDTDGQLRDVADAAFSRDGRRLVTIGKTLLVWDLTARDPFARPILDLATPGFCVAVDDSARWVASMDVRRWAAASIDARLQIWDLSLPVPAVFPIDTKSTSVPSGEFLPSEVKLRFAAGGKWLVLMREDSKWAPEFWDLRFEGLESNGNLARRNLSAAEWRSFFGDLAYRKTFPDQPLNPDALLAADNLARAGLVKEAVEAYRKVASEAGVKLDPERRAYRLASSFYWLKGESEAGGGNYEPIGANYESGLDLLRKAKKMNPAIPWDAEARAGQLWARQWEDVADRLGNTRTFSEGKPMDVEALLAVLRKILLRYPTARSFHYTGRMYAPTSRLYSLYQVGLLQLANRTRDIADTGALDEALRLRSILAREHSPDVPSEDEVHQRATTQLKRFGPKQPEKP